MTFLNALFIAILIHLESSGNDYAVGDEGNALGCLQIWPCVVRDYNSWTGENLGDDECFDREHSTHICYTYLGHYGKAAERELSGSISLREMAMIWNGGPDGYKGHKPSAVAYGHRFVKEYISKHGLNEYVLQDLGTNMIDLHKPHMLEN